MRKRVILHVGPHKTGSTYLQKQFAKSGDAYAAAGITYPADGMANYSHGPIVSSLRGWGPGMDTVTPETFSAIAQSDTVLLSSENFVLLKAEELQQLRDALPDHDFEIVFVLRSLARILPSHWQETIKHGNDNTYLAYLARAHGLTEGDLSHVMPAQQLDKLGDVFGYDALTIISYENALAKGGDLFDAFSKFVLKTPAEVPPADTRAARVNVSFPPHRIELIRSLNETYRRKQRDVARTTMRVPYMAHRREIEKSPEFSAFALAFDETCFEVTLRESDPFIREQSQTVLREFGSRIVNKHSDTRVLINPEVTSATKAVFPNWTLPAEAAFVDSLFARLLETAA